jgi:hypothetical protein
MGKSAGGANSSIYYYRFIIVVIFGQMSSDFAYEFYVYFLIKKFVIGMRYFTPVETQHAASLRGWDMLRLYGGI